jgi:hypothetical protein
MCLCFGCAMAEVTGVAIAQPTVMLTPQARRVDQVVSSAIDRLGLSKPVAQLGVDRLHDLANAPGVAETFGIQGASLQSSELGIPLAVFVVPLDSLRPYRPHRPYALQDSASLLVDGKRVLYPINVADSARLYVAVQRRGSVWRRAETGGASYAQLLFGLRDSLRTHDPAHPRMFLVDIEHTDLSFLGLLTPSRFDLIALSDDRQGRWTRGARLPASVVFAALASLNVKNDGLHSD